MASAAPLADYKECEQLRDKVTEETKNPSEEVSPADLYKRAVLMSRWAANTPLPLCLLCRKSNKKLKNGHIFPKSVLKTLEKKREREGKGSCSYMDFHRGANMKGASNCAYHVFCGDCEQVFQQGENHFNDDFFRPLCTNVDGQHEVSVKETRQESSFPWLYFCLISIIWRSLCFIPEIVHNSTFIEVLEYLRSYLLDWKNVKIDGRVELFLFAPNCEVDKKLEAGSEINKWWFYDWVFFTTQVLVLENPNGTNNSLTGWLFLGPLHVLMLYSEDSFAFMEGDEIFTKWKESCSLTSETNEITIADKEGRFFPVAVCDTIIKLGRKVVSTITRHWLPKDISYDRDRHRFCFNDMFVEKWAKRLQIKLQGIGNEKEILFVVLQNFVNSEGELTMRLHLNPDGTVEFMKGANVPKRSFGWNSNDPPFKNMIKGLLKDLAVLTRSMEPTYDRDRDRFSFNDVFVESWALAVLMKIVKAERKGNKEEIFFVAFQGGVTNGEGELAMGLHVNPDGTVEFMKGVNVPRHLFAWNSNDPPFKNMIEGLLKDLPVLTRSTEHKEEETNSGVSK